MAQRADIRGPRPQAWESARRGSRPEGARQAAQQSRPLGLLFAWWLATQAFGLGYRISPRSGLLVDSLITVLAKPFFVQQTVGVGH